MNVPTLSPKVVLGRTPLNVLRMGMGGIPIQRLSFEQSDRVLEKAVDQGITFFDTARIYTDSESKMGRVLPRYRKQVVIATKTFSRDGQSVEKDIDTSLSQLKTDHIDLYQCHNIASPEELAKVLSADGALEALVRAQKSGKIGHIGLSGHKPWIVEKAIESFPFASIQIPFNYLETKALERVIPLAQKNRIGVIAMKPVGGGNIREISLNFRFIFQNGIDVAIPGMDSEEQVMENVAVLGELAPVNLGETGRLEQEKSRLGDHFCRRCEYCMPCPQGLPIAFLHVMKNYYFLYDLKDWVLERLKTLSRTYKDCTACRTCVSRCPYQLDSPAIFKKTWEAIRSDKGD